MKKCILAVFCMLLASVGYAQSVWPSHQVTDLNGKVKELSGLAPEKGLVLFVFWKTCCPNNITMIDELQDVWLEHDNEERPVKVVLVSIDDQRSISRVKPIVRTNGWEFEVILDKNMDLARIYQVNMPPQWIACDAAGKVVYRSKITNGYLDSAVYFEELIQLITQ